MCCASLKKEKKNFNKAVPNLYDICPICPWQSDTILGDSSSKRLKLEIGNKEFIYLSIHLINHFAHQETTQSNKMTLRTIVYSITKISKIEMPDLLYQMMDKETEEFGKVDMLE